MAGISIVFIIIASIVGLFVFLYFVHVNLWITAIFSGVRVVLFELMFMRIRKVTKRNIVESLITMTKAGLAVSTSELETHYLAVSKVTSVIKEVISADKTNINLTYEQATAIELAV